MKQRYVGLRDLSIDAPITRGPVRAGIKALPQAGVSVESVMVDRREVDDLLREKNVTAVVPAIRMRLIEPLGGPVKRVKQDPVTWGVKAVGADTSPCDGRGIRVAVLDTGINKSHPAFDGVRNFTVRDFTGEGEEDKNGHGTHCAGTIFGRAVKGVRIGVAPGITDVLIGKVLGKFGCTSDEMANAVLWAAENNAHIISMSLGMDFPGHVKSLVKEQKMQIELATSRALEDYRANVLLFERLASMLRVRANAPLLIAAAGNESRRELDPSFEIAVSPPAVSEGFVSVGAVGQGPKGWRIANFSNVGATVCGPGEDVVSTDLKQGLVSMSGTSMAAPHVAGVAALWAQRAVAERQVVSATLHGRLTGRAVTDQLEPGYNPLAVGHGMVWAPQKGR